LTIDVLEVGAKSKIQKRVGDDDKTLTTTNRPLKFLFDSFIPSAIRSNARRADSGTLEANSRPEPRIGGAWTLTKLLVLSLSRDTEN
jgi:hypothetical protein